MPKFLGGAIYESGPGNFRYEPHRTDAGGPVYTSAASEYLDLDEAINAFYADAREEGVECSVDVYEYKDTPETRSYRPREHDPARGTD